MNQHVDINFGVDFELALEKLQAKAGRLFRVYRAIKASGTPGAIEQAYEDYVVAQDRAQSLRAYDTAEIRAILASRIDK